jgi:3-hydroxybutyryl-CoA dehydratase
MKYSEITIGQKAVFSKTISESDIYLFAGVTGDFNPVHINEEFAKTTMFKTRIAHGMLGAGLISTILGTQLPGPGTIYLGQELKFKAAVKIGDTITAECEIIEKNDEKKILKVKTTVKNQANVVVIDGLATVLKQDA